jgi:hypothetical protein
MDVSPRVFQTIGAKKVAGSEPGLPSHRVARVRAGVLSPQLTEAVLAELRTMGHLASPQKPKSPRGNVQLGED